MSAADLEKLARDTTENILTMPVINKYLMPEISGFILAALQRAVADEQERHAQLQARCYEDFPSASDGIFDALKEAEAQLAATKTDYGLLSDDYKAIADSNQKLRAQLAEAKASEQRSWAEWQKLSDELAAAKAEIVEMNSYVKQAKNVADQLAAAKELLLESVKHMQIRLWRSKEIYQRIQNFLSPQQQTKRKE